MATPKIDISKLTSQELADLKNQIEKAEKTRTFQVQFTIRFREANSCVPNLNDLSYLKESLVNVLYDRYELEGGTEGILGQILIDEVTPKVK